MNRSKSVIQQRRDAILEYIRSKDSDQLDIKQMAQELNVSEVTIRRDLSYLEFMGVIKRRYGKVSAVTNTESNEASQSDDILERIAGKAAEFVEDGDIIFLNTSITALRMLKHIKAANVTVVTNNIFAANTPHRNDLTLIFTGGEVRYPKYAMVGDIAQRTIMSMKASKTFLGCSGLTIANGMTTEHLSEVGVNELMLSQNGGEIFLLTNHFKLGVDSNFVSGNIRQIKTLITDNDADPGIIEQFREAGLEIIQV